MLNQGLAKVSGKDYVLNNFKFVNHIILVITYSIFLFYTQNPRTMK